MTLQQICMNCLARRQGDMCKTNQLPIKDNIEKNFCPRGRFPAVITEEAIRQEIRLLRQGGCCDPPRKVVNE